MALSFRLTGLTPTEWANEDAERWNRNMRIRNAYAEGAQWATNDFEAARDLADARAE